MPPFGKSRRRQDGGTLLGLAFGLVVGVLISFGVVWYLNKTPLPFQERVTRSEPKETGGDNKAAGTPIALPGKPGDKPAERKFEFYDILEGKKEAAPVASPPALAKSAGAAAPTPPAPAAGAAAAATGGLYLQAGAFQKAADAENLKARLAMLGFEANVLDIEVPDKGRMHRVRIGPHAGTEDLNRVRGQLSQNGIPTTVVRVKEDAHP